MRNENMVTVQLSLEAFGFTGMSKQEIEAALLTAIDCKIIFTKCSGESFELQSCFEPKIENLTVVDEDGIEIYQEEEFLF